MGTLIRTLTRTVTLVVGPLAVATMALLLPMHASAAGGSGCDEARPGQCPTTTTTVKPTTTTAAASTTTVKSTTTTAATTTTTPASTTTVPASTTTSSASTTTTPASTSTSAVTTTTAAVTTTSLGSGAVVPTTVPASTTSLGSSAEPPLGSGLPHTGSRSGPLLGGAAALLTIGVGARWWARRPATQPDEGERPNR